MQYTDRRRGNYEGLDPALSATERVTGKPSPADRKANPENHRTAAAYQAWLERQGNSTMDQTAFLSQLRRREEALGVTSFSDRGSGPERPRSVRLNAAWPDEPTPNQHAGICVQCGTPVAAGQGRIVKTGHGWDTAHREGQHPARAVEAPVAPREPLRRPNKYDDVCAECKKPVRAGEGQIVKRSSGYGVVHANGECETKSGRPAGLPATGRWTS